MSEHDPTWVPGDGWIDPPEQLRAAMMKPAPLIPVAASHGPTPVAARPSYEFDVRRAQDEQIRARTLASSGQSTVVRFSDAVTPSGRAEREKAAAAVLAATAAQVGDTIRGMGFRVSDVASALASTAVTRGLREAAQPPMTPGQPPAPHDTPEARA